jgi:hypothetical protein
LCVAGSAENPTPQKAVAFTNGLGRTIEISGYFFILISCSLKCEFHSVDVFTFKHLFWIFAHHFIPITAAAMSWAESFGSQPDCDDDESRIDVEQAVNSVIARGKRWIDWL